MAKNVINFKLVGFKELEAKLVGLGKKSAKKVVRLAVAASGRPIAKAAKAKVPVRYGNLKKSIGSKVKTYPTGAFVVIGPREGFVQVVDGVKHDPVNYAHLVEYGTAPHDITPENRKSLHWNDDTFGEAFAGVVHHPGTPAQPFLRVAFDSQKDNALNVLKTKLAEGIEREAAKGGA